MTDLFLYDVKAADSKIHKQLTGVENQLILHNLRRLSEAGKEIIVRIPFIPGQNDDQIEKIGEILKPLKLVKVEIMPYHKLGNGKYAALGMKNELSQIEIPTDEQVDKAITILKNFGLNTDRT